MSKTPAIKAPRKPGRPPAQAPGQPPITPEPINSVVARHRANAKAAGHSRIEVTISPDATDALHEIIQSQGNTPSQKGAKKAAVEAALIQTAKLISR
jgi:hypothetical protein